MKFDLWIIVYEVHTNAFFPFQKLNCDRKFEKAEPTTRKRCHMPCMKTIKHYKTSIKDAILLLTPFLSNPFPTFPTFSGFTLRRFHSLYS